MKQKCSTKDDPSSLKENPGEFNALILAVFRTKLKKS